MAIIQLRNEAGDTSKFDFKKEFLLVFSWAGSGQDKLTFGVNDGKAAFFYAAGLTRDLRPHFYAYVLKNKTTWDVKNKKGETTFQGPINTPEDHKKLPPEIMARLETIGGAEMGDDDDDLEVETKVLEPVTKTRRILPPPGAPEAGLRSL